MRNGFLIIGWYLAAAIALIYGVLNRVPDETWVVLVLLGLGHLIFGYKVDRWWIFVLPLVLIPISIPADYPPSEFSEPIPIWAVFIYAVPVLIVLTGLGRLGGLLDDWLNRRRARSS